MMSENTSQDSGSTGSSESTDSGSSSGSDTSTQTTSTQNATSTSQGDTSGTATIAAPIYQPNFKFKSFGKEQEIDPLFRGLIKDKDSEEKIRKLHEKAYAMEPFQNESKKYKTEFDAYKSKTEPDIRAMGHFNNLLAKKDWDNFFGGLKVPEEEIFNWVQKRLELRSMAPEQRAEFEKQTQVRQQNYAYENQISQSQKQYQQLATETRTMQLDNTLARADVLSQAEQIDRVYGEPGAFRNLVIEEAMNHFNRTGEDLSAAQAVQMAVQKYSRFMSQQQNQGAMGQQPQMGMQGGGQQITSTANAPVIPHVGGSARSPIKKSPRSIEDLKQMAKNLQT